METKYKKVRIVTLWCDEDMCWIDLNDLTLSEMLEMGMVVLDEIAEFTEEEIIIDSEFALD